ncbi:MAG: PDZ domain-containing protein [Caldilineae bacterium]|nr:MAG: PDZ domain-containing protein [Caldilineae bacterium]
MCANRTCAPTEHQNATEDMRMEPKKIVTRLFTATRARSMLLRGVVATALVLGVLVTGSGASVYAQSSDTDNPAPAVDLPTPEPGILVASVQADSPAAQAGLVRGDIVLAVDGDAVNTLAELNFILRTHKPGDEISLTVKHGDEERTLTVTLGDNNGRAHLGLIPAQPVTKGRARAFAMPFGMHGFRGMPYGGRGFGQGRFAPGVEGAVIVDVLEEGAAATAGLQPGDVVTAVDDQPIASGQDLVDAIAAHQPGDEVALTVERNGETQSITVTLGAHPDDETKAFLGVQVGAMRARGRQGQGFNMPYGDMMPFGNMPFENMPGQGGAFRGPKLAAGAVILDVAADSPAAQAGLQAGDVVTAVGDVEVQSFQDLADAIAAHQPGDEVALTVERNGETQSITVTLGAHPDDETKAYLGVQVMPAGAFRGDFDRRMGPGVPFGMPGFGDMDRFHGMPWHGNQAPFRGMPGFQHPWQGQPDQSQPDQGQGTPGQQMETPAPSTAWESV